MHIFIDNYGVKIDVDNGMLRFVSESDEKVLSIKKVKSLHCFQATNITGAAIVLASEHQVPILFYNALGRVECWLWSHKYGNIADLRVKQAFYSQSSDRLVWITLVIEQKIEGQIKNLEWLTTRKQRYGDELKKHIDNLKSIIISMKSGAQTLSKIRSYEALASKQYWDMVFKVLEKHTDATSRIKRGATDSFNSALNYLYAILYGQIEASLLMYGLDPYIGLMHINRHDKPALAFDHIEPFRPWVDRLVMVLMIGGFDSDINYETESDPPRISKAGRKTLIETFFSFMEQRSNKQGKRIRHKDQIHQLSGQLVESLKKYQIPHWEEKNAQSHKIITDNETETDLL